MEPSESLPDAIMNVRRYYEGLRKGNRYKDSITLKLSGKRERVFNLYEVINVNTGAHHHYNLTIETYQLHDGVWTISIPKSVTISGDDPNELNAIRTLLDISEKKLLPENSGEYIVIPKESDIDPDALRGVVATASFSQKSNLFVELMQQVGRNPNLLEELSRGASANREDFKQLAAALNYARYSAALEQLRELVASSEDERAFQLLLEDNPWMFGSEYSQRLDRRRWSRDSDFDHMLRRTSDGYLELIEIKTPLNSKNLFLFDKSHECYYPSAPVSQVVGQTVHYLEKLDQDRLRIAALDKEDVCKVRAKIIIGRDSEEWPVAALRNLNGHLHRIEVITYDQLIRIAERVLDLMRVSIMEIAGEAGCDPAASWQEFDDLSET